LRLFELAEIRGRQKNEGLGERLKGLEAHERRLFLRSVGQRRSGKKHPVRLAPGHMKSRMTADGSGPFSGGCFFSFYVAEASAQRCRPCCSASGLRLKGLRFPLFRHQRSGLTGSCLKRLPRG